MFLLFVAGKNCECLNLSKMAISPIFVLSGSTYTPSLRETVTRGWCLEKARAVV